MAVWFSANHRTEFSDSSRLGFECQYPGWFWFRDGCKMHVEFFCELFFGTFFGLSLRSASWLNL